MFKFLLGVLILVSNFLGVPRAIAEMGVGSGPGVMTMPIRGCARWAALALALALLPPAAANAQNAYITNFGDGTVSVIDTAANTVVATIPVGSRPDGVAVTPGWCQGLYREHDEPRHGLCDRYGEQYSRQNDPCRPLPVWRSDHSGWHEGLCR